MNTRFVYFVRHGECQANIDGVIAGAGDDSPLTEVGKEQAENTAENLRGIDFDLIITSPMARASETALIIARKLGLDDKVIEKVEFTEKDVGYFSGKSKEEYFAFEKSGGEVGEHTSVMQERCRVGLDWLKAQDFKNALVVSHNGTVRMIKTILDNLPAKEFTHIKALENGEFLKVEFD